MSDTSVQNYSTLLTGDISFVTTQSGEIERSVLRRIADNDTVESAHFLKTADHLSLDGRPELGAPEIASSGSSDQEDALDELTQAFCAVFSTMATGIQSETNGLQQMQILDNTNSLEVVDSSNQAIALELTAESLEKDVSDAQADQANLQSSLGWIQWLGLGMSVIALLMSIPTGGASDALAMDELGTEMATRGASLGADGAGAGLDSLGALQKVANTAETVATNAGDAASNAAESAAGGARQVNNGIEIAPKTSNFNISRASEFENNEPSFAKAADSRGSILEERAPVNPRAIQGSEKSFYLRDGGWTDGKDYQNFGWFSRRWEDVKWATGNLPRLTTTAINTATRTSEAWRLQAVRYIFGLVGTACASVPQGLDGWKSTQVAQKQYALEAEQRLVGPQSAIVQENQMNFQFFQQLCQRQTGVIQNSGEQLSDVIMLAGAIMKGYQQVQSNLVHPA